MKDFYDLKTTSYLITSKLETLARYHHMMFIDRYKEEMHQLEALIKKLSDDFLEIKDDRS